MRILMFVKKDGTEFFGECELEIPYIPRIGEHIRHADYYQGELGACDLLVQEICYTNEIQKGVSAGTPGEWLIAITCEIVDNENYFDLDG